METSMEKSYVICISQRIMDLLDCGQKAEVLVYHRWDVKIGDRIRWMLDGNRCGVAEIVDLVGPQGRLMATIKKVD